MVISFLRALFVVTWNYLLIWGMFFGLHRLFGVTRAAIYVFAPYAIAIFLAANLLASRPGRWMEGVWISRAPVMLRVVALLVLTLLVPIAAWLYFSGRTTLAGTSAVVQWLLTVCALTKWKAESLELTQRENA